MLLVIGVARGCPGFGDPTPTNTRCSVGTQEEAIMINNFFYDISNAGAGGAIFVSAAYLVNISHCGFSNCQTTGTAEVANGGMAFLMLVIAGSRVEYACADVCKSGATAHSGGGFYSTRAECDLLQCRFKGCVHGRSGGAIGSVSPSLGLLRCNFTSSTCPATAAAIDDGDGGMSVEYSIFLNSRITTSPTAMTACLTRSSARIVYFLSCLFLDNPTRVILGRAEFTRCYLDSTIVYTGPTEGLLPNATMYQCFLQADVVPMTDGYYFEDCMTGANASVCEGEVIVIAGSCQMIQVCGFIGPPTAPPPESPTGSLTPTVVFIVSFSLRDQDDDTQGSAVESPTASSLPGWDPPTPVASNVPPLPPLATSVAVNQTGLAMPTPRRTPQATVLLDPGES
jgi:hypothetical protein